MHTNDLDPDLPPSEHEGIARMAARLEKERPAPPAAFRGDLGRAVTADEQRRRLRPRPAHLWVMVASLVATGSALLGLAASQL